MCCVAFLGKNLFAKRECELRSITRDWFTFCILFIFIRRIWIGRTLPLLITATATKLTKNQEISEIGKKSAIVDRGLDSAGAPQLLLFFVSISDCVFILSVFLLHIHDHIHGNYLECLFFAIYLIVELYSIIILHIIMALRRTWHKSYLLYMRLSPFRGKKIVAQKYYKFIW